MFPPSNLEGDLPPSVYPATLAEILAHFGTGTVQRQAVATRLERVYRLIQSTGQLFRFVVYGSFVTAKPEPGDVDVFFLMEDAFDAGAQAGELAILLNHLAAQDYFGASVFWATRRGALGGEQAAIEDWQVKRGG